MNLQAAVDVGGTFTDLTVQQDGVLRFTKVPTTPARIHEGVLGALEQAEIDLAGVERLVHGSTIVINTIIQRSGARTALVTTKGFGDVLEIGRANRPDMYNFRYQKPVPFVPRERCFEVSGRLDAAGRLVEPLDDAALDELVASIAASGAEAVAVCTLHSYANPEHEAAIADRLRVELPVSVSASHEISSLWREYERASTTVLNAYAHPAVSTYLGRLESDLEGRGFGAPFNLVQSSGGLTDAHDARVRPVTLVESGPVAGVAGSARLGDALGVRDVISFDVGGTTAKCAVVKDGRLPITDDYAIEHSHRFPGYPVQVPTVDIVEIGAGGGSLARATAEGSVRVGPESAGASPGPACYGWGGDQPTVTDAALLAGWLDPDYFLGGRMRLHPGAAEAAVRDLSEQVGLSVDETAAGILRLAHEGLAGALRLVTLEQGHDPRDFVLCASGGAGPMHAALLARDLGIGRVLVPPSAGTFSAWAMLLLDRRADAAVTKLVALDDYDAAVFEELRAVAAARLGAAVEKDERVVAMRYRGQEHTLEVVVPEEAALDDLAGRFHSAHHARFGFSLRDNDMECVSFRVAVLAAAERASLPPAATRDDASAVSHRRVSFGDEVVERTPVYVRASLGAGARLDGPAVVEEETSTALVPPETRSEVDRFGNLMIELPVSVDPFTREIVSHQLRSAAREMFVTLGRASQSPIIYEVLDYACGICDSDGALVAEAEGIPGFIGTLGHACAEMLAQHGSDMRPGDIYALNDPFRGGGTHLSDVALVAPIFFDGERVAFGVNKAHWTEVGGASAGSWNPATREIFQEGLVFPGVPVYRAGELNDSLVALIRANVRLPDETLGDLFSGVAGIRAAEQRVQAMCRRFGSATLRAAMDEMHDVGERHARAALSHLPAGTYHAEDHMDDDASSDEPLPVCVTVDLSAEAMRCDFTGSAPQVAGSVNSTWSSLHAACRSAFKAVVGPDLATTDGLFRPLEIVAPSGCIFNARHPAPVGVYWESSDYATDLIWKALAPVVPERLPAGHHLSVCGTLLSGDGFIMVEAQAGGWGGACDRDGQSALYPCGDGDTRNIPAEVAEHRYPIRVVRYELRRDSAGGGRFRGGRGLVRDYEILGDDVRITASFGRHRFLPWGVDGGAPGSENAVEVYRDGKLLVRAGKLSDLELRRGDVVRIITGSGGGWGRAE